MGFLTNIWTRYTDRSEAQVVQNVLTNLQNEVPEITDHSLANLFVKVVRIFAGIAELLHYYIDTAAREAHLDGCRFYKSGVKISRMTDYRISSSQGAIVTLTFSYTSTTTLTFTGTTIPAGAIVSTGDGVRFVTLEPLNIPAGSFETATGQVDAQNIDPVPFFTLTQGDGTPNQKYTLTDEIAGFSVAVRISAVIWDNVETLAYSKPTDTHFRQTVNEEGKVTLEFGDGINGAIPPAAVDIDVEYNKTSGAAGNVAGQTIVQIISGVPNVPNYVATVTNNAQATGGRGVEPLDSIKTGVPRATRTRLRAVTELDFLDLAILHPQVENAGVIFTCGKTVDLYVVPVGGGIAPPALLAAVVAWFEDKRLITHRVRAFSAGEVNIQATVDVTAKSSAQNSVVQAAAEQAWLDFFSSTNQNVGGTIFIGDLYELFETIDGVANSVVTLLAAEPYAQPIGGTTNVLNWTREVTPHAGGTDTWKILVINATDYELSKNGNFVGVFNFGVVNVQSGLTFTVIAAGYTVGDEWQFITYPYDGRSIVLNEPSIPTSDLTYLTLTVGGGQ